MNKNANYGIPIHDYIEKRFFKGFEKHSELYSVVDKMVLRKK